MNGVTSEATCELFLQRSMVIDMHPFPLNSNAGGNGKKELTFPGMTKNDADLLKNAWANVVKEFIEDLLRRRKVVVAVYGARPRDWDVL